MPKPVTRTYAIRSGNKRGAFNRRRSTSVNYFVYAIFSAEFMAARSAMSIVDLFSSAYTRVRSRSCAREQKLRAYKPLHIHTQITQTHDRPRQIRRSPLRRFLLPRRVRPLLNRSARDLCRMCLIQKFDGVSRINTGIDKAEF